MWTNQKSAWFSLVVTYVFMAATLLLILFGPKTVDWYLAFTGKGGILRVIILTELYVCAAPAVIALVSLRTLLKNILKENIFVPQNVLMLRILSWCCFFVAIASAVFCFEYFPFILIAVAAAFIALILRVVKNVIKSAVELKQENDMTI